MGDLKKHHGRKGVELGTQEPGVNCLLALAAGPVIATQCICDITTKKGVNTEYSCEFSSLNHTSSVNQYDVFCMVRGTEMGQLYIKTITTVQIPRLIERRTRVH